MSHENFSWPVYSIESKGCDVMLLSAETLKKVRGVGWGEEAVYEPITQVLPNNACFSDI